MLLRISSCALIGGIPKQLIADDLDRMQHRRMIAVEGSADIGQRLFGILAGQIHGDLPRKGDGFFPRARLEIWILTLNWPLTSSPMVAAVQHLTYADDRGNHLADQIEIDMAAGQSVPWPGRQ